MSFYRVRTTDPMSQDFQIFWQNSTNQLPRSSTRIEERESIEETSSDFSMHMITARAMRSFQDENVIFLLIFILNTIANWHF